MRALISLKSLTDWLAKVCESGGEFLRLPRFEEKFAENGSGILLKHDVHNVSSVTLETLADTERALGVSATYFFPEAEIGTKLLGISRRRYERLIQRIASAGHITGLHFDVWRAFRAGTNIRTVFEKEIAIHHGVTGMTVANLHGNTSIGLKNRDGHNLTYEFFSELSRGISMSGIDAELKARIKRTKTSLRELEVDYWVDAWCWSRAQGSIPSNYVSDNYSKDEYSLRLSPSTAIGESRRSMRGTEGTENAPNSASGDFTPATFPVRSMRTGLWTVLLHPQFLGTHPKAPKLV